MFSASHGSATRPSRRAHSGRLAWRVGNGGAIGTPAVGAALSWSVAGGAAASGAGASVVAGFCAGVGGFGASGNGREFCSGIGRIMAHAHGGLESGRRVWRALRSPSGRGGTGESG